MPKQRALHVPSDVQAKDKLSLYVYEYLMHMGAKQAAQTFLNEIRFEAKVPFNLNEPPGFLLSWWCVFWDLYCAAPERRDNMQNDCTNEAKAFHDYGFINSGGYNVPNGQMPNNAAHSPLTQMPPQEGMGPNNMQPNFFPPNSQPPPPNTPVNTMMMGNQGYPRYPSGPRPMRVPSTNDYNGPNSVSPQMGMDAGRIPPMSPMNRLTPPGGRMQNPSQVPPSALSQMGNYNSPSSQPPPPPQGQQPPSNNMGMRQGPPSQMGPQLSGSPMPMNMPNQPRWSGPQSAGPPMNYSSPSPGVAYGTPCVPGPGTPIMQSPQDPGGDMNYAMMKNVPGGMNYHDPNMSHMVPMNQHMDHSQHINGDMIDSLKNSPISNIQQNPRHPEEHSNAGPINDMGSFSHFGDGSVQNESDIAILKLKECMQEETKRFEKQTHHNDMYPECN